MWDDPKLADDHRNLGLIGTTDGVLFFDDQKRGTLLYIYYKKSYVSEHRQKNLLFRHTDTFYT